MSFTPDGFIKKLDNLEDTQDSIVSISQWVLFHHRHIDAITKVWSKYIIESSVSKKLPLLYLCNDIAQQAKHKRQPDLIKSFALVLPTVLDKIYSQLDAVTKGKVDRLLGVWEQRQVFLPEDLEAMKAELGQSGVPKKINNSPKPPVVHVQSEEIVSELKELNELYKHMNHLVDVSQNGLNEVGIRSLRYLPRDPANSEQLPKPDTYLSKLNTLEEMCCRTSDSIDDIKKDRFKVLQALDSIKHIVEEGLKIDDSRKSNIQQKLSKLRQVRNELQNLGVVANDDDFNDDDDLYIANGINLTDKIHNEKLAQYYHDSDSDFPTYANDSMSEEDHSLVSSLKRHRTPSISEKAGNKKSVAFSNNIEVKEYNRDNQTEIIKIIKSDDDHDADDTDEYDGGLSEQGEYETSEYDPGSVPLTETAHANPTSSSVSVMELLSKLS